MRLSLLLACCIVALASSAAAQGLSRRGRLCPRRGDERARPQAVLRARSLGLGQDVVRHLPRSGAWLRACRRARGRIGRRRSAAERRARRAVARISPGRAAIHRAFLRCGRFRQRERRQRANGRPHLGRPRRSRPRPGALSAAVALRDGEPQSCRGRRPRAREGLWRAAPPHRQGPVRGDPRRARNLRAGCAVVLSLQQQVRRGSRRQGRAFARGSARARALRGSGQGQLRPLPHQPARRRRTAAAIHRLRFCRRCAAAQPRHPGQCRSQAISISACAGRCAPISPRARSIAACS